MCPSDRVSLPPAPSHHTQTQADRHIVNTGSITFNHNHRVFSSAKQHDICPKASVQSHSHTQHTVSRMRLRALKLHGAQHTSPSVPRSCGSYYTSLFFRLPTPSSDGQRHCLRSSQQADRRQMWDQGNGRKSQPPSLQAGCCARRPVGNTAVDWREHLFDENTQKQPLPHKNDQPYCYRSVSGTVVRLSAEGTQIKQEARRTRPTGNTHAHTHTHTQALD